MKRIVLTLLLSFVAELVLAVQVTPSYQMLTLKKGKKGYVSFKVLNNEEIDLKVTPQSKDWFVLPENEGIHATDWLTPSATTFLLRQGDARVVEYKVKVPRKAQGELVGMVTFLTEDIRPGANIRKRMSIAVYVGIEGTEILEAEIAKFKIQQSTQLIRAGVQLNNTGNIHVRPQGLIKVLDRDDKAYLNFVLQNKRPAYPGRLETYVAEIPGGTLAPGKYKAHITMTDQDRLEPFIDETRHFIVKKDLQIKIK